MVETGWLVPSAGLEGDPQAVLQAIRRYVRTFFGCKECGEHFEGMAAESMDSVKTPDQAILWLWKQHNRVNSRLAGRQSQRGALGGGSESWGAP